MQEFIEIPVDFADPVNTRLLVDSVDESLSEVFDSDPTPASGVGRYAVTGVFDILPTKSVVVDGRAASRFEIVTWRSQVAEFVTIVTNFDRACDQWRNTVTQVWRTIRPSSSSSS